MVEIPTRVLAPYSGLVEVVAEAHVDVVEAQAGNGAYMTTQVVAEVVVAILSVLLGQITLEAVAEGEAAVVQAHLLGQAARGEFLAAGELVQVAAEQHQEVTEVQEAVLKLGCGFTDERNYT